MEAEYQTQRMGKYPGFWMLLFRPSPLHTLCKLMAHYITKKSETAYGNALQTLKKLGPFPSPTEIHSFPPVSSVRHGLFPDAFLDSGTQFSRSRMFPFDFPLLFSLHHFELAQNTSKSDHIRPLHHSTRCIGASVTSILYPS